MPRHRPHRPPHERHTTQMAPLDTTGMIIGPTDAPHGVVRIVPPVFAPRQDGTFDPLADPVYTSAPLETQEQPALAIPSDWSHGALLNVRNGGEYYVVTLFPEEYDWQHPERALKFPNPARCQDFVSKWYARQNFDPRAF